MSGTGYCFPETWHEENEMSDEAFKAAFPDVEITFVRYRKQAYEYAASLHDPRCLNWVNVEWMWM